ncbi:hypothetical protein [Nocardia higoensis]|uniref:hypothetical protein n=1 Tax=Nocardia higoensis TaxID=228599 RepID=UPI0002F147B6|nr:hypothetical protein [Nocardia higoensis]
MAVQLTQRILDRSLSRAVVTATAPSGIRITEGQLYYELCRLLAPTHRLPRRLSRTTPAPLRYSTFRAALDRHGPIPEVLAPIEPRPADIGRHTGEPDLFDYGLPRLLICTSHAIAHMLRANGLPMESACPVLSAAELPLHPGLAAMLERVCGTVYLLHESSAYGLGFAARIRELTALPQNVRIVPIGLRPRQARALHLFHTDAPPTSEAVPIAGDSTLPSGDPRIETGPYPETVTPAPGGPAIAAPEPAGATSLSETPSVPALDAAERRWLARGHTVELEAVRPAALLRTVHRLVRGVRTTREPLLDLRRARTAGFLTWPAA